jgi:hypothetical protein
MKGGGSLAIAAAKQVHQGFDRQGLKQMLFCVGNQLVRGNVFDRDNRH